MSLYSRLFRRAPSAIRENKEDFLSEALGDLLGRLPQTTARQFVQYVLLKGIGDEDWVAQFMHGLNGKSLDWETQYRITAPNESFNVRRPDLVLFVDRCPMLVVEAKVDAATDDNQLQAYADWLAHEARADGRHTVVILLLDRGEKPGCAGLQKIAGPGLQHIGFVHWSDVKTWLQESALAEASQFTRELWPSLGQELVDFMYEIGVGATSAKAGPASLTDVEIGQAFFPSLPRLTATLDAVTAGTATIRSSIAPSKEPTKAQINQNCSTIWSWVWLVNPPAVKWYAGWGFYFPTPGDNYYDLWQPSPKGSYFFVSIEADVNIGRQIRTLNRQNLPPNWVIWPGKGLLKILPLQPGISDGAGLASGLTDWTVKSLEEIWPTVKALAEAS